MTQTLRKGDKSLILPPAGVVLLPSCRLSAFSPVSIIFLTSIGNRLWCTLLALLLSGWTVHFGRQLTRRALSQIYMYSNNWLINVERSASKRPIRHLLGNVLHRNESVSKSWGREWEVAQILLSASDTRARFFTTLEELLSFQLFSEAGLSSLTAKLNLRNSRPKLIQI